MKKYYIYVKNEPKITYGKSIPVFSFYVYVNLLCICKVAYVYVM